MICHAPQQSLLSRVSPQGSQLMAEEIPKKEKAVSAGCGVEGAGNAVMGARPAVWHARRK